MEDGAEPGGRDRRTGHTALTFVGQRVGLTEERATFVRCLILRVLRGLGGRALPFVGDAYKRIPGGGVQLVWKDVSSNRASHFLVSL